MLILENIPVQLKINSVGSINTGRYFNQHDNGVAKFNFTIFREDGSELDYSNISKAYMIIKFQDGTCLEPLECEVGDASITTDLSCKILCKTGTVSGALRIYSSSDQVITTNIFRFGIVPDILDGVEVSDDQKISIINQMISDLSNISFEEDARQRSELDRIGAEQLRNEAEILRNSAEIQRQNEFEQMKAEHVSLVTVLKDSLNQMIVFDIPSFKNPPEDEINRILFSVPTGYKCTITGIKIISNGDAVAIDDTNTSRIQIIEGTDIISDTVFNLTNSFPSANETMDLTIIDGLVDKDDNVYIKVTNGLEVETPNFSLQLNYDIEKMT